MDIKMEDLGNLAGVPLEIEAVLEARVMKISDILHLQPGSLIRMNRAAGESVQVRVGGVWVGEGDVLAVYDKMCVRLTAFRERA